MTASSHCIHGIWPPYLCKAPSLLLLGENSEFLEENFEAFGQGSIARPLSSLISQPLLNSSVECTTAQRTDVVVLKDACSSKNWCSIVSMVSLA